MLIKESKMSWYTALLVMDKILWLKILCFVWTNLLKLGDSDGAWMEAFIIVAKVCSDGEPCDLELTATASYCKIDCTWEWANEIEEKKALRWMSVIHRPPGQDDRKPPCELVLDRETHSWSQQVNVTIFPILMLYRRTFITNKGSCVSTAHA